jgi:autotransporter-associated beta strand protein
VDDIPGLVVSGLSVSGFANHTAAPGVSLTLAGPVTCRQPITLYGAIPLVLPAGDVTFDLDFGCYFVIGAGLSGAGRLHKIGEGHLELTAPSTFTGGALVENGAVRVAASDALGSGPVDVPAGGELHLYYDATISNPVSISGTGARGSESAVFSNCGVNELAGPVTVPAPTSYFIGACDGDTLVLTGPVFGPGPLTVRQGILVMAGPPGVGTGLERLTIRAHGALVLGADEQIADSATLELSNEPFPNGELPAGLFDAEGHDETVGELLASGDVYLGVVDPGDSASGDPPNPHYAHLTTGYLVLGTSLHLLVGSDGADRLTVHGPVYPSGTLSVEVAEPPPIGQNIVVIDKDGTDPIDTRFNGLPEAGVVDTDKGPFRISYSGGSGNDVTLTRLADPPPAPPVDPPPPVDPVPVPPTPPPATARSGYWALTGDGHVYNFGDAAPLGNTPPRAVDIEGTPRGNGYWTLNQDGTVRAFGDASPLGNVDPRTLAAGEFPASLSATPSGRGYWVFTNRGRAIPYGDAAFLGDMSKAKLNEPVLGSVATPTGRGYYMVAADGGIFAFGDATFAGSMGGHSLNAPVTSLVPDGDGHGYWLVGSDGGIFAFDAHFRGSMGGRSINKPVVGMVRYGDGYLMVGADGGIFNFSTSPFAGSLGDKPPASPVVAVAALS